ncbi:S41 family peptidase [Thauera mechernichensis]
MREADLVGHLGNGKGGEGEAVKPEAGRGADAGAEEAEPVRFELAGENDHQLQQAIRLLKGEQIVQNQE